MDADAAQRGQAEQVRAGLIGAGVFTFLFLAGQLWAWQQLNAAGYFLASDPAASFFYLLTALHGLHLLGGLWSGEDHGQGAARRRDRQGTAQR
jgi:cytochrome c oxidase subunit 3